MELKNQIRDIIAENPNVNFEELAKQIDTKITCGRIWEKLLELSTEDKIIIEGEEDQETFRIKPGCNAYTEAVQDLTLNCFEVLYRQAGDNADSRIILQDIRIWANEFENWWWSLKESERDKRGYLESIDVFSQSILHPHAGATRDSNLQEFTAHAISDNIFSYLIGELNLCREDAFAEIRKWADEFWEDYKERDPFEDYKRGESYYDCVDAFMSQKIKTLKENN